MSIDVKAREIHSTLGPVVESSGVLIDIPDSEFHSMLSLVLNRVAC